MEREIRMVPFVDSHRLSRCINNPRIEESVVTEVTPSCHLSTDILESKRSCT